MALRRCEKCTTRFAVGLTACPNCGSKSHHEDGARKKKPAAKP